MKYFKQYPVTLRHFFDRPAYAAAAGYDFNFFDCMAFTAHKYVECMSSYNWFFWLDTEIRELPFTAVTLLTMIFIAVTTPFIYPVYGVATYVMCRRAKKVKHTEIIDRNITGWLMRFK